MQPKGLPRFCRLHLKRDFKEIIRGGIKLQYRNLSLWYRRQELPTSAPVRFAVVVSSKLGPAVLRNRAKRLLREAFRLNRQYILAGTDIIINPKGCDALSDVHAAQEALKSLLGQAELLNDSSN